MIKKLLCLLFWFCFMLGTCAAAYAAEGGLYEKEILRFDEEGNLIMTSYDGIASYATTYRTLGWTIKRYDLPVDSSGNTCVAIQLENGGSLLDPENPGYVYSYFYCDRDTVFKRIGEVSKEWQTELYQNGAIVYLDGIMTVCENGMPRGALKEEGRKTAGEVYTTYEGIAGARGWGPISLESLKTHFNKQVEFFPVKELLEPEGSREDINLEYQYFHFSKEETAPDIQAEAGIASRQFNVEQGIPSGENVDGYGALTPYGFRCGYERVSGTKRYSVPVEISYQMEWEDDEGEIWTEYYTASESCVVSRSYTYWLVRELELFYGSRIRIKNGSLPEGAVNLDTGYEPEVKITESESHMIEPDIPTLSIDLGLLTNGYTGGSYQADAEAAVEEILVKNDYFSIDGQTILNDSWNKTSTEKYRQPEEPPEITVEKKDIEIPFFKANENYSSAGWAIYRGYGYPENSLGTVSMAIAFVNPVQVHTPVVCIGNTSDDKHLNQMVTPDRERASFILGEPFTVTLSTYGAHRDIKGYGEMDYRKYAAQTQVKFPFPVLQGEKEINEGIWIDIEQEASFHLPTEVKEGTYQIKYRSVAWNGAYVYQGMELLEERANINPEHYIAEQTREVVVMGRIYGFQVTDIHDYPRWEGIFETPLAKENGIYGYRPGSRNQNGVPQKVPEIFTLPVWPGSNPKLPEAGAIKTGYHFRFEMTSIGSFYGQQDNIYIEPVFYYINKDTGERYEADLYYSNTESGKYQNLKAMAKSLTLNSQNRTLSEKSHAIQKWKGEYYLPQRIYAVKKEEPLPDAGISGKTWLSNGYLLVNFQIWIRNGENKILSYHNQINALDGYCNMWKLEGFTYKKTDGNGLTQNLQDGDTIFYDLDNSLFTDYRCMGTH